MCASTSEWTGYLVGGLVVVAAAGVVAVVVSKVVGGPWGTASVVWDWEGCGCSLLCEKIWSCGLLVLLGPQATRAGSWIHQEATHLLDLTWFVPT
jgi:hypothetical protein